MRFTRLTLLLIAGILALGFHRLYDYLLEDLEAQTFQAAEETMVDAAHIFAAAAESHLTEASLTPEVRDAFAKTFRNADERTFAAQIFVKTKREVTLECYLTDSEGHVVYDSGGRWRGRDFSQFNDVYQTRLGKYGARSTRSEEEDATTSVMYVGAPIHFDGQFVGVATAYKPQKDLLPYVSARRAQILRPVIAIGVAILVLIGAVLVWVYRPIGKLAHYARGISAGERPPFPRLGKGREVNALGTALKEMRETLEGRSYVENYTQTLTHELKSPLAAIRGSAELLDEDMPREQRHRFLENIRTEADRSERLINRLLHLAALEGKTELPKPVEIDLAKVVTEACDRSQTQAELAQVTLAHELPDEPLQVTGDFYILRAALENLIENALEFSPQNSEVIIALRRDKQHGVITVADQGPGLPDYALGKAFERFFSHRPEQSSSKGSGLGLPFVKEAAMLHRGEATLSNREPKGALATLRLPLAK